MSPVAIRHERLVNALLYASSTLDNDAPSILACAIPAWMARLASARLKVFRVTILLHLSNLVVTVRVKQIRQIDPLWEGLCRNPIRYTVLHARLKRGRCLCN